MMNPGYDDIVPTSNAPLRAGKASVYEGLACHGSCTEKAQ